MSERPGKIKEMGEVLEQVTQINKRIRSNADEFPQNADLEDCSRSQ